MPDFPHHYSVSAAALVDGDVELCSPRLATLRSAPPTEFGGPGDRWSPETLLVAAVADCFVLSFRAIARASRFQWSTIDCEAIGTLDRVERITQLTAFELRVRLMIPPECDVEQARRLLDKAEQLCLISNSLKAVIHLEPEIECLTASVNSRP